MAWEWVSPAASATVALAAMYFTWRSIKLSQYQAKNRAETERRQRRLADAYVELLTLASETGQWVALVRPFIRYGEAPPPLPSLAAQARAEARILAFGSETVHTLFLEWRKVVNEIVLANSMLSSATMAHASGQQSRVNQADVWRRLPALRTAESQARQQLADQAAQELGSRLGVREADTVPDVAAVDPAVTTAHTIDR
ncbi:hypothetical protein [Actinocatenispora rupis]|uniref:Uncharacterized protein n=1 Tax=Actinocatenispora rupis TaxID=519421 RepID=A0A8J3NCI9_9ACTN|nr:hypothetical protein [Actinocatenispora rupis]GID14091.1 hypothetical protein Aru02nite_49800 [Actinocatenispora rupis]